MLEIIQENSLKKDIKKCQKRGYNFEEFKAVVTQLAAGEELAPKYRVHLLTNNWSGYWECYIKPDWLLIYKLTESTLTLVRTGTHSDLFR